MVAFNHPARVRNGTAVPVTPCQLNAQLDAALVSRFRAGDDNAFTEIVVRHRRRTFALALARLHNHADAEEITQDTFIRAHRALAGFRNESSLTTWLHRITVNLAHNRYWYFCRRRHYVNQSLDRPLAVAGAATWADLVASDAPGPARETMTREFAQLVAEGMERLAAPYAEILHLRNVLEFSYHEIAVRLRLNVGTVKSRIARARASLLELIAAACPEYAADASAPEWFGPSRPGGV